MSGTSARDVSASARPGWLREVGVAALVLAVAVLIRWPYLQQIPRFNDEVTLWREAVAVQDDGARPLVFEDTGYNGALLIYVLAAARALSRDLATPRLMALVVGSGGVLALYLAGRALHSRLAGLVAAALFGVTMTSVLVYSHVLHMVGLAILFQLLGWWAAIRAARDGRGGWLVVAAALTGLAAQTHPLSVTFVPGLLVWLWLQPLGRGLLRSRWALFSALALLLALSPIIAYHLPTLLGESNSRLAGAGRRISEGWGLSTYPGGVASLARTLVDTASGVRHDETFAVWGDPLALVMAVLAVVSLIYISPRQPLPLCLTLSALVCMPVAVRDFNTTLLGRYAGLAVPALYLAMGVAAAMLVQADGRSPSRTLARRLAMTLALLGVLAGMTLRLTTFYSDEVAANRTNADFFATVAAVDRDGWPVVLDGSIKRTNGQGTGPSGVLRGMFAWQGHDIKRESTPDQLDAYLRAITWPANLIVADDTLAGLSVRRQLQPVPGRQVAPLPDVKGWGLYHFTPTGGSN